MTSTANHASTPEIAGWSFVAMEYYALVLNRTFLITIQDGALRGVVCRGMTSTDSDDPLAKLAVEKMVVRGNLNDPKSYVDAQRMKRTSSANFSIPLSSIAKVEHNPGKKWGMGPYPHDGRVFVHAGGKKREFIILGRQSGREIAEHLRKHSGVPLA